MALIENTDDNLTYMIYTDSTFDSDGMLNLFVSLVCREGDTFRLEKIEDYEEIDLVTKR